MKRYLIPSCEFTGINTEDIMQASYESFRIANKIESVDLDTDRNIDIINT